MTNWEYMLVALDCFLTNKDSKQSLHSIRQQSNVFSPLAWLEMEGEFYLSDSGYSRIVLYVDGSDNVMIRLTDNSLEYAKKNWQYCKELISDIEQTLTRELKSALSKGD